MKRTNTDLPMTAIEFQDKFRSEEDCARMIAKLRWPNGFTCPNCEHDDAYFVSTRNLYQCTLCHHQTSVTAGTLFHGTKIPLRNWFWMIYIVSTDKGGASATRIASQLGMYQKTVWHILHKIRDAMGSRDEAITLAGLIELDEAIVGPEARKRGRQQLGKEAYSPGRHKGMRSLGLTSKSGSQKKTQTEILVLIEDEGETAGNLAMKVLDYTDRLDIAEVVEQRVDEMQSFKTDAKQAHWVIESMGHNLVAKKSGGPYSVVWLPHVHRAIALLKRFLLGTYHGVSGRYLDRYLKEFCFRFNRRHKPCSIWESLLKACVYKLPLTYTEIRL